MHECLLCERDTHEGFHGDGEAFVKVYFTKLLINS